MSFPAIEVLSEYRGLPGFQSRKNQFLRNPFHHSAGRWLWFMELGLLELAEFDREPVPEYALKSPVEALEEAREL